MSTEIIIEKGILMPRRPKGGRSFVYPWLKMEVGDSFFTTTKGVRSAAANAGKTMKPKKFSTMMIEGGVRVWRVK